MSEANHYRLVTWLSAAATTVALLMAGELVARSSATANYIALRPSDIVSEASYAAKVASFAQAAAPKVAVLGDSVALGKVLADHGIAHWRDLGLSAALRSSLTAAGHVVRVADFSTNGLLPSEDAQVLRDVALAGADAAVMVIGLRGFSRDFEEPGQRYTAAWRGDPSRDSWPGSLLSTLWRTRGVLDFLINDALGGPLATALTELRRRWRAASPDPTTESLLLLRARQRLSTVDPDRETRFQASELFNALRALDQLGIPVVAVYATEDPNSLRRLMTGTNIERARAALEGLVRNSGRIHRYLGPDRTLNRALMVDHIHPTPEGYRLMADRIVPVLLSAIHARSADE